MDGPLDPLATARTGGLSSRVQLDEDNGPGVLGEVFIADGEERRTTASVRGMKIVQVYCSRKNLNVALDDQGVAHDLNSGQVLSDVSLASLALGDDFVAGIGLEDERLYTWGNGDQGHLGLGHTRGSALPEAVASMEPHSITQVACGQGHGLALSSTGAVYSWGRGLEGQIGQGLANEVDLKAQPHRAFRLVPKMVQGLHRVRITAIACGAHFSAALDSSGAVWTWGQGLCGQLGTGRCTARTIPRRVIGPSTREETARSSAQASSSQDGTAQNGRVKAANETVEDYLDVLPASARDALCGKQTDTISNEGDERIEAAHQDRMASKQLDEEDDDVTVHPEGTEASCREGQQVVSTKDSCQADAASKEGSSSPVAQLDFATLSTSKASEEPCKNEQGTDVFVGIACGDAHVLALNEAGGILAWGLNAHGQLGLGDFDSRSAPTELPVSCLPPVASVSACGHASSATSVDGIPYTWGYGHKLAGPQKLVVREDKPNARIALGQVSPNAGAIVVIPTLASSVHPSNGPLEGGHEIAIGGVGFWESGCIKVRFVPMQRNETDEDAAIGAGSEAGLNEDENDPDLSDDGLDLDDNASGVSSESSQSNAAPSDPRETQIVPGEFDPETGHIKCVAPPCPLSGIVLVQVAVDGSTFTTDEIFYIYTEPCTLQSAAPRAFSCAVEDRQQLRTITMEATGLYAMPEVCLRLSIPDTGKELNVPATVRQQVPSSEEEDRELGLPADEVSADRKVQAEATFAMNEAIDALVGPEATSCVAEIAVSLNGISFASTAHLPESVRTCVLSRPCITHMFPRGLPCVAKSDSAIELGPIQLSVTGLVPEHTDAVRMRMKSLHDGAESSLQFELPAKTNAELTKVSFDAPRLGPDVLPNGQVWGLLPFEIAITFDDGQSWVTSSGPLVYFAGQLEAPRPLALPACGGELEISTSEEHAGWIYSEAEPIVAFSSPQRPSLPAVQSNQICITKESSLIVCSTGDLGDLYAKVREFMRQQLQAQILQEYLDENPLPEAPDDPEAEDDDARAARETATTEARQLAETHAAQEAARADLLPVELNVMVALNGRDFVHQFPGSLELFAHPQVTSVEPSEKLLTLASSDPADDSSPSAVADTDGGEPDEICTVQVTSPFSLPQVSARTTLRFTHRLLGHVHDVPARTPDSEDEEAGNTEASATSRTVQCTIPRFQHAGVYEISVALNGVDFPPYLEETLRSEDAEMQDENDLDGTAEAARNTFTVLEPPEDEDCKQ